jgi:hypothetical protein
MRSYRVEQRRYWPPTVRNCVQRLPNNSEAKGYCTIECSTEWSFVMLVLVFHNIKTKALQREVKDIVTTYETRQFLEPDRTATGVSQRSVKACLPTFLRRVKAFGSLLENTGTNNQGQGCLKFRKHCFTKNETMNTYSNKSQWSSSLCRRWSSRLIKPMAKSHSDTFCLLNKNLVPFLVT